LQKNGSAQRRNQNKGTAPHHTAARHQPHFHPCRGLLPANKPLQTNHHSKGNAASSLFQQSITETPTGASAAVPPVHSRHCHHTADPPAPDGDLIIKENRLDR